MSYYYTGILSYNHVLFKSYTVYYEVKNRRVKHNNYYSKHVKPPGNLPPPQKNTVLTSYVDMTRSPTEDLVKFVNNNYDDLWWVFDGNYPSIIQIYCDIRITYVENEVQDWLEVVGLQRLLRHYVWIFARAPIQISTGGVASVIECNLRLL